MKKIVALGILVTLSGCATKTQYQAPIETIVKAPVVVKEPTVVVEVEPQNNTESLYIDSDSVAMKEETLPLDTTTTLSDATENTISTPPLPIETPDAETQQTVEPVPQKQNFTGDDYQATRVQGYSIQILALRSPEGFKPYLAKILNPKTAWINEKKVNGSNVYTLLLGHYANYEQAKAALLTLPLNIQQSGAFVRNFADIENTAAPMLKKIR